MKKKILLPLLFLLFATEFLFAQGVRIDSTFGINGYAIANPLTGKATDAVTCRVMALTNKGNIILAGRSNQTDIPGQLAESIVKLNRDGSKNTTFGTGGGVNYQPYPGEPSQEITAITEKDGKFVVMANYYDDAPKVLMTKFNADGSIDYGWGNNGIIEIYNFVNNATIGPRAVALQSDGKLVVVAECDNNISGSQTIKSWRFHTDGLPDYSYGVNGVVDLSNAYFSWRLNPSGMLIQSDGKIVIGGSGYLVDNSNIQGFVLIRLGTDGVPDHTWGGTGLVYQNFNSSAPSRIVSLAKQSHGKIIAIGSVNYGAHFGFMSFKSDGSLNTKFNKTGKHELENINGIANSVAVQSDGKIVAAGTNTENGGQIACLVRLNANGKIDSSFGTFGVITPPASTFYEFTAVVVDANDNIVACGNGAVDFTPYTMSTAVRYIPNLSVNLKNMNAIASESKIDKPSTDFIYPNPVQSNATFSYTLDKDGPVSLSLYDLGGRLLQTILQNENQKAGKHQQQIHFSNELAAGNYLLVIQTSTKKAGIQITKQ